MNIFLSNMFLSIISLERFQNLVTANINRLNHLTYSSISGGKTVDTISLSHLYLSHFEKASEMWTPPNVNTFALVPMSLVHISKVSLYLEKLLNIS